MKERPIIFSGPMVRALLAGTKTQTRRVFKAKNGGTWPNAKDIPGMAQILRNCPYGQPGRDRLYVRETWAAPHAYDHLPPRLIPKDARIHYSATEERGGLRWRPSIHMPRWASRITLEITGVRVERLQDISEADARSEGCTQNHNGYFWGGPHQTGGMKQMATALQAYQDLWESINGPGSWEANPWVWVLEFRRINSKEIEHAQ